MKIQRKCISVQFEQIEKFDEKKIINRSLLDWLIKKFIQGHTWGNIFHELKVPTMCLFVYVCQRNLTSTQAQFRNNRSLNSDRTSTPLIIQSNQPPYSWLGFSFPEKSFERFLCESEGCIFIFIEYFSPKVPSGVSSILLQKWCLIYSTKSFELEFPFSFHSTKFSRFIAFHQRFATQSGAFKQMPIINGLKRNSLS